HTRSKRDWSSDVCSSDLDSSQTAITPANYKFSYKGTKEVDGRLLHVYQLKPRKKRVGLFKGHIYLDAHTGSLVRAEGRAVKSPRSEERRVGKEDRARRGR